MIKVYGRIIAKTVIVLGLACTSHAGDWTEPVEVRHEQVRCVSYRAKQDGPFLVVQATLDPDWHTFAMDNKERAAERLAGRRSLGIDLPTEISVTQGLEVAGPWFQSPPQDFSKPEIRWFSWGFENQALFVTKVRRSGTGPARVAIRGQACTETSCKNIDVALSVPLAVAGANPAPSDIDVKALIQVR
jgi:hypothetical protein